MSVSIYYRAERGDPLTAGEQRQIDDVVSLMSVDEKIEDYLAGAQPDGKGAGLNWESFSVYEADIGSDVVFAGSTKLPDNTDDAMWIGVQHWCALLTMIRTFIPDAEWQVFVHDHQITWNDTEQAFDPT